MVSRRPVEPHGAPDHQARTPAVDDPLDRLDADIETYNATLATLGISLRLERRGGRIGLRGLLPDLGGQGQRVQRLSLGLPATAEGLDLALAKLRSVAAQLEVGTFRWSDWRSPRHPGGPAGRPGADADASGATPSGGSDSRRPGRRAPAPGSGDPGAAQPIPDTTTPSLDRSEQGGGRTVVLEPTSEWLTMAPSKSSSLGQLLSALDRFERRFRSDPRRQHQPAGSRSTWTAAYRPYLRRLVAMAQETDCPHVSAALLRSTLESYAPGSSGRQRCASALAALAELESIDLPADWGALSAGYGLHVARFRQLPSDDQILSLVTLIPNPGWRLVYGLMATYGLRNHEAFFCDLSALRAGGDKVLRVLPNTKTGEHQVWPFQPEWVQAFELERLGRHPEALPPVARDLRRTTLRHAGRRVAEQFRRYGLPITPYDLRHAWAVRTIHVGLPDSVAARMMGHSVAIHTRTYHHWITRRDQQRAVDAALARLQEA